MNDGVSTYDLALLENSWRKWRSSTAVRMVYENIYRDMASRANPGRAVEIGSGCGTAREFIPGIVTTDICRTPFVDYAASAYEIETVPDGPWATIYALDVLHHLRKPVEFFASAARALAPGGRIIICDPAATPWGRVFYNVFHHEPMIPAKIVPPYCFPADSAAGDFANMAMAEMFFGRSRSNFRELLLPLGLKIKSVSYRDLVAYPATGGLSRRVLLPVALLRIVLRMENRLPQFVLRFAGLRMIVVVEKIA